MQQKGCSKRGCRVRLLATVLGVFGDVAAEGRGEVGKGGDGGGVNVELDDGKLVADDLALAQLAPLGGLQEVFMLLAMKELG